MNAQLLVVGSVNADLTVTAPRLPGPGETVTGGRFARGQGGKGANQAVAACRAGAEVLFVGATGDDDDGRSARAALAADGVDVRLVAVAGGAPTGVALIVVGEDGANQIAVAPGANDLVDPAAAARAVGELDPARAGLLLSFELPDPPLVAAAGAAVRDGLPVVCNPAPARALPAALRGHGIVLTPNEPEAAALAGEGDPGRSAQALARETGGAVVVTLGAAGALVVEPGGHESRVPAPRVDVVDTTGAGDVFSGVLAAALAGRSPLREAVAQAIEAASLSVTRRGAR